MSAAATPGSPDGPPRRPIVIAHRGACGYRPEHTLEAYALAIGQGADFIEPDLVATSDGVLIARHENEISGTTDVAAHPAFADRRTTKQVDGRPVTGWFSEDFSLAEIKTLRARERLPALRPDSRAHDGLYAIPTFAEVLQLARRERGDGRVTGVYPETKHPTYFAVEGRRRDGRAIGMSLGAMLLQVLVAEGFTDPRRVFIQSFEPGNLIELKRTLMPALGLDLPLVQLFDDLDTTGPYDLRHHARGGTDLAALYPGLATQVDGGLGADTGYRALAGESALRWMHANYASVVAPWKDNLLPRAGGAADPLLAHALRAGLWVHPYTLRAEDVRERGAGLDPRPVVDEALQLYGLGVDGLFFDQPDLGVAARDLFVARQARAPDDHVAAPGALR